VVVEVGFMGWVGGCCCFTCHDLVAVIAVREDGWTVYV